MTCAFNPAPGSVFPPSPHPQMWWTVMYELARKRIKEYISSEVSPHLQARVYVVCQTMYRHVGLQGTWGQQSSDGIRQTAKSGKRQSPRVLGYDQNITTLMEMNLADRSRAEQALDVMHNNLARAIDFLLVARSQ